MAEYIEKMKLFTKAGKMYGNGSREQIMIMKIVNEIIEDDVEKVNRGEWLVCNGIVSCSICKEKAKLEDYDDTAPFGGYAETQYCPNCGAKMGGGKANDL